MTASTEPDLPPDQTDDEAQRARDRRTASFGLRREADRRLAAVIESISDAFLSLDAGWRVTYANREVCRLNRTTPEALVGRDHWSVWPETVGSEVERQYRRAMSENVAVRFEHHYAAADIWHAIYAYPAEGGGLAIFYRDVTPEKRAAEAMRAQAELVELAQDAILVRDADDRITFWNPAAEATYGYAAAEAHGRRSHELLQTVFPAPLAEIGSIAARDGVWGGELVHTRRDGSRVHVSSRWAVRRDDAGRVTSTLEVNRDVTATKRAEAEREAALREAHAARAEAELARAEAERANAVKAQFLATMSHELRTPLNAIGGYAQLMELGVHGHVTPEQLRDLSRIQHAQQHLLGLINSVLNYAKLEAGRVEYALQPVPLAATIADVEALVSPQLRAKAVDYAFQRCDEALRVRADPEKLRQILINLLTNAVKFTPGGGRVTTACTAHGADAVAVRVEDSGVGIAPDRLQSVFDPFVQVGRRLTSVAEGVGLGLAISRDLARGMGGDLTATSEEGVGSAFTLVLPRA